MGDHFLNVQGELSQLTSRILRRSPMPERIASIEVSLAIARWCLVQDHVGEDFDTRRKMQCTGSVKGMCQVMEQE